MNYKQNEKINQVKESTLVVGIDIGSTTQYARAFDWRGIELFLFVFVSNGFTLEQVCSQLTIRLVVTALILYIIVVVLINSFAINVVHSEHKKEKIIRTQKQNISRKNQIKELIFAITITLAAGFGYTYWIAETTEQRREDYKILELTNTDDEDMMYAVVYETQDSYIVVLQN